MGHKYHQMENSLMDIPKILRSSTLSSCVVSSDSIEDLYFDITSFDDSCIQNSTLKRSSCNKNFDSSSDLHVEYENYSVLKSSRVSFIEDQVKNNTENSEETKENKKHSRYKSLLSMIKILKKFSVKETKKANCEQQTKSILRRPREYTFVKGISGLSIRVEKVPSSSKTFCHRCYMRNG